MSDYIKRSDAARAMAQYMMDTALIDNPEASDSIEEWEGNIAAPVMSTVKAADVVERDSAGYEWCTDCKEYDKEKHCCPRWNKVIRDTVDEIRQNADVRENITAHKVIGGGEHDGATCWFECSRCGKTVDVNDKYCSECGARFES